MISTKAQNVVSSPTVKDDARASRMSRMPASPKCFLLINWMQLRRPESEFHACWLVRCLQSSEVSGPPELIAHRSKTDCTNEIFQPRTRESSVHSAMLCSVFLASVAIFVDPRAQRRELAPWKRASVGRRSRQVPPTRNDDDPRRSSTSVGVDEFGSRWHSTSNLPLQWTKVGRVRACVLKRLEKADGKRSFTSSSRIYSTVSHPSFSNNFG